MNDQLYYLANQKKTTNHIFHLLMSILTCGFWLVVWLCIATSNNNHNARVDKDMKRVLYYKEQGANDVDVSKRLREEKVRAAKSERKAILLVFGIVVVFVYLWLRG